MIEAHGKNKDVRLVEILKKCQSCYTLLKVMVISDEFVKMWKKVVVL